MRESQLSQGTTASIWERNSSRLVLLRWPDDSRSPNEVCFDAISGLRLVRETMSHYTKDAGRIRFPRPSGNGFWAGGET